MNEMEGQWVNGKYRILERLGAGSFGCTFRGQNMRTMEYVAIKMESIESGTKLLKNEAKIYQYLNPTPHVPQVKWFGKDEENYYLVLTLYGHSLQEMMNQHHSFSISSVKKIGIQIIEILRDIHSKTLLHRDIKPDNFLFGFGKKGCKQLHLVDFGFSKTFLDHETGGHIPMGLTHGFIGSESFASIHAHRCLELSRRDDLESLGYMLLYFYLGTLPWKHLPSGSGRTLQLKEQITTMPIVPDELKDYFTNIRALAFEQKPDYDFLIQLFQN